MPNITWFLFTILVSSNICNAYKILLVFPMPGKSHSILGYGIARHLLNAGHEVTYITAVVEKNTNPKLHLIDVSKNFEVIPKDLMTIKALMENKEAVQDVRILMFLMTMTQTMTIENENVQKLLNDPTQTFDLVIAEWMFSEICAGYAAVYNAPMIWLSSVEPHWLITRLVDEPLNPAYNGDTVSNVMPPFTFQQRVQELWHMMKIQFHFYIYNDGMERKEYDRLLAPIILKKGRQPPTFDDVKFNASLVLGNSHVSLGQATRLPQNYKPIAGYHINEEVKPLPEDLKKIMDNAKNGVIYFSMGSNLKSKDMPEELKKSLLKMFSGLKQTILWKFEEIFPNLPENVHVLKWAPQDGILSHPNCVLFITHGGLLSTTETVHFGVPIVGIPVFADQFINVDRAVNKGIAKRVDLSYTMTDELKVAIEEMTSNPRYKERVKELSLVYHDRPVRPGVELVHWVEHVARTRGAAHLRSPALHVPWHQKMYLDLAAVLIAVIIGVIILLKRVYSLLFLSKQKDNVKKNN